MKTLVENNLLRFISICKTKDGMFANFKAKGVRGGTSFTASIAVDLNSLNLNIDEDPLEKLVDVASKTALKEFKQTDLHFEGL